MKSRQVASFAASSGSVSRAWSLAFNGNAEAGEFARSEGFGFAGDDEQFGVMFAVQPVAERVPSIEWPVFFGRSAARVKGDGVGRVILNAPFGGA